jgi:hypothetical protein
VLRTSANAGESAVDAIVARPTLSGDYTATARIVAVATNGAMAGIAAYGDNDNAIGMSRSGPSVVVWIREKGVQRTLASADVGSAASLELRIVATDGRRLQFAFSTDGREWRTIGEEADGGYLPPWDRAVRIALVAGGRPTADARFDWVRIETRTAPASAPR